MSISAPFIGRPIATSLVMAAIFLVGAVAYPILPVAPLPQIDFPTIQVSASLPGASPETMASSVAAPLERQFAQIAGVAQMTSASTLGSTAVRRAARSAGVPFRPFGHRADRHHPADRHRQEERDHDDRFRHSRRA
jgi:hypothetical protein